MADIDSKKIQELREKTNAGFVKCKQVLVETGGDIEKAVDLLRAQGIKALEKMSTDTKEGYFGFYQDDSGACYVELLCVTDFVAKNDIFVSSANEIAKNLMLNCSNIIDQAGKITKDMSEIIPDHIDKLLSLKENIKIGRHIIMHKLCGGKVPVFSNDIIDDTDKQLIIDIKQSTQKVTALLEAYKFRDSLFEVIDLARKGNKYMQDKEPWMVAKRQTVDGILSAEGKKSIDNCLHLCLQLTANLTILINPFLPFTASKLCKMMKVVDRMLEWENAQ